MAQILLAVCVLSCCSSSSSAAAFFAGLIPRTGPHFLKVSGVDDLTKQKPFIVDYYQKSADKKTDKEKQLVVDEIRNTNPDGVTAFCAAADKIRTIRTTPPYNQPGDILTIGGMKRPADILEETAKESLRDAYPYVEITAKNFCGK
jgi:hypothetical protein